MQLSLGYDGCELYGVLLYVSHYSPREVWFINLSLQPHNKTTQLKLHLPKWNLYFAEYYLTSYLVCCCDTRGEKKKGSFSQPSSWLYFKFCSFKIYTLVLGFKCFQYRNLTTKKTIIVIRYSRTLQPYMSSMSLRNITVSALLQSWQCLKLGVSW